MLSESRVSGNKDWSGSNGIKKSFRVPIPENKLIHCSIIDFLLIISNHHALFGWKKYWYLFLSFNYSNRVYNNWFHVGINERLIANIISIKQKIKNVNQYYTRFVRFAAVGTSDY